MNKIYLTKNSFWKFYEVRSERGDFNWYRFWASWVTMCFNAVAVEAKTSLLLLRLTGHTVSVPIKPGKKDQIRFKFHNFLDICYSETCFKIFFKVFAILSYFQQPMAFESSCKFFDDSKHSIIVNLIFKYHTSMT